MSDRDWALKAANAQLIALVREAFPKMMAMRVMGLNDGWLDRARPFVDGRGSGTESPTARPHRKVSAEESQE